MDCQQNARLTILSREQVARKVMQQGLAAAKWVRRYREQGESAMCDRSSRLD